MDDLSVEMSQRIRQTVQRRETPYVPREYADSDRQYTEREPRARRQLNFDDDAGVLPTGRRNVLQAIVKDYFFEAALVASCVAATVILALITARVHSKAVQTKYYTKTAKLYLETLTVLSAFVTVCTLIAMFRPVHVRQRVLVVSWTLLVIVCIMGGVIVANLKPRQKPSASDSSTLAPALTKLARALAYTTVFTALVYPVSMLRL